MYERNRIILRAFGQQLWNFNENGGVLAELLVGRRARTELFYVY